MNGNGKTVIDAHCHFFNAEYALAEFASATWNMLWGNYPHHTEPDGKRSAEKRLSVDGVRNFVEWIAKLLVVALSNCEGNYKFSRNAFKQSKLNPYGDLISVPLMMDIYFALDDNGDEEVSDADGASRKAKVEPIYAPGPIQEDELDEHLKNLKQLIRSEMERKAPEGFDSKSIDDHLDEHFQAVRQIIMDHHAQAKAVDIYAGIEMSPGYKKHLEALEKLQKNKPGKVFPFLAIDPRRRGIMKLIELKVSKGEGPFRGIKLYPPLGYLPTHPNLVPVFDYCAQYDIPITVHTSDGGLQNFRRSNYVVSTQSKRGHWEDFSGTGGSKSGFYAAPANWRPVLEQWKTLRINFAHFGGCDALNKWDTQSPEPRWLSDIVDLINQDDIYPNVYTDISYYVADGINGKVQLIRSNHPKLNGKMMFGTDFVMIMLEKDLGGLTEYFNRFSGLDELILRENAGRFLKIGEPVAKSAAPEEKELSPAVS